MSRDLLNCTSASLLLVLSICGCGTSGPNTAVPQPSSPPAEVKLEPPAPRTFDVAAEKELKQKGHFGPKEVEESARTYAGVRWRFEAEVMRLDAAEPSQFHTQTVTVQPNGLARAYVRLRLPDAKDRLYPGQRHLFEGTFERYILQSGLDALVFNDVTVVSP